MDLDIGLKYDALLKGEVDAILVFTTDGRISDPAIVVLQDESNYFEKYYAGTVVREETLAAYPQLRSVLELSLIHISSHIVKTADPLFQTPSCTHLRFDTNLLLCLHSTISISESHDFYRHVYIRAGLQAGGG